METNIANTIGSLALIGALVLVLSIAGSVARAHRRARHSELMASAERELSQAQVGIRRHARTDPGYKPRTIGGGR